MRGREGERGGERGREEVRGREGYNLHQWSVQNGSVNY